MTDQQEQPVPKRRRRRAIAAGGVLASGLVAGGVTLATLSTASASAATPTAGTPAARSSTPVRSDEKVVSGTLSAKLKAAALGAVPGGTVYRIETDAGDGVYEAHMTKADGTQVTVKFDKNGKVTKVETGMGSGDPAPAGGTGHGGPGRGGQPGGERPGGAPAGAPGAATG